MSTSHETGHVENADRAPGEGHNSHENAKQYFIGLVFATILTLCSFWVADTAKIWGPGVPVLLAVLAIAQMGVHVVFFFHLTSAPDQTNNFLALAFGIFVVALVVFGTMLIMWNLNMNMIPMDKLMQMQR